VPKDGQAPNAEDIKTFALANAPAYAHPRFVWLVDELPLASTNKLDRALLRHLAQERIGISSRVGKGARFDD
jgi:acyl-CoA synthetase (AMP-forming)/AMP-acid ligase II